MPTAVKPHSGMGLELISASSFNGKALLRASTALYRLADVDTVVNLQPSDRTGRAVYSTPGVAMDGHRIFPSAWNWDDYLRRGGAMLWSHSPETPPVARTTSLRIVDDCLVGDFVFAEWDLAETIYQLARNNFGLAISVGFMPTEYRAAADRERARQGGLDITKATLIEASFVSCPSDSDALIQAVRSCHVEQSMLRWTERALESAVANPLYQRAELEYVRRSLMSTNRRAGKTNENSDDQTEDGADGGEDCNDEQRAETSDWTVGASRDLPVADSDGSWDGPAAASRMLDDATTKGGDGEADKIDSAKAKRGFLVYDAANSDLRGSYKLPFADIGDGGLKAIPSGIRAAASRLPQTDVPQDVKDKAAGVLDHYKEKAGIGADNQDDGGKSRSRPRRTRATAKWDECAERVLPIGSDKAWDGPAAAARQLDAATTDKGGKNEKFNIALARRGFLVYDSANPELRDSYKLPFADIEDGELKAMPNGLRAAASRLPQTSGVPSEIIDIAREVIGHYEEKMAIGDGAGDGAGDGPDNGDAVNRDGKISKTEKFLIATRGMNHVAWLAMLIDDLGYLAQSVEQENEMEGDDSQIPGRLWAIVTTIGQILADMLPEEIAELIQDDDDGVDDADVSVGVRLIRAINKRFYRPAARTAMEAAYGALMDAASGHEWPDGILTAQQAGRLVRSLGKRFEIPDVERLPPVVDGVYRAVMEASAGRDWPTGVLTQDEGMRLCDVVCRHFGVIKPPPAPETMEPATTPADISLQALSLVADMVRSGRVLSADNDRKIRGAIESIMTGVMTGVGVLREVCDAAAAIEDDQAADDGDAGGVNGDITDAVTEMVLPVRATKPPARQATEPAQRPQNPMPPSPVIGFEDAATRQRRARALALKQKTTYMAG